MYEPTSDARQAARATWDFYNALQQIGFSEAQAMRLVEASVRGVFAGEAAGDE